MFPTASLERRRLTASHLVDPESPQRPSASELPMSMRCFGFGAGLTRLKSGDWINFPWIVRSQTSKARCTTQRRGDNDMFPKASLERRRLIALHLVDPENPQRPAASELPRLHG